MKKCSLLGLVLYCCIFSGTSAFAAGASVDGSLQMVLPYVEYGGKRFQLVMDFYLNPLDPTGIYWKFKSVGSTTVAEQQGGVVDQALNISGVTVIYTGQQLTLDLSSYANPNDQAGFYWKISGIQTVPGAIESVSGGGLQCFDFDPAQLMEIINCLTSCGQEVECLSSCYGNVGSFGAFSLSLQFNNPTSTEVEFKIPPATVFVPADSGLQPMMVLHEPPFTLAPGISTVCVTTYCLDSGLSAPADTDAYSQGGITTNGCLQEIINLTYGKSLAETVMMIQNIIWECTDTGSISSESRTYLQGL